MRKHDYTNYLIISLTLGLFGSVAISREESSSCLYAVTRGATSTPVVACPDKDPLLLGENEDILNILTQYDIDPNIVRFRGCVNLHFSATHDQSADKLHKYVITYPSNVSEDYSAAITHEIAHVFQMKNNGGLEGLRNIYDSRQVELEADYLTGVVSSRNLTNKILNNFQHSLLLMGSYIELDSDAHGKPGQRVSAFRMGAFSHNFSDTKFSNMRDASMHFHTNVYGVILNDL